MLMSHELKYQEKTHGPVDGGRHPAKEAGQGLEDYPEYCEAHVRTHSRTQTNMKAAM
jgi:hypothetical protein